MTFVCALLLAFSLLVRPAGAAERSFTIGEMSVTEWSSDSVKDAKRPVIIFSHGFHGCATQSRFLTEALAAAGYLVYAPNHRDATCAGGDAKWTGRPEQSFRDAVEWNEATYRDRADDIRRLVNALQADERVRARADFSRVGLAGHSLGGYTVLGLAGAWPSWKMTGISAVLALSPYSQPFVDHRTLANVAVPVMYQGGTRDFGITPTLHKSMGAYEQSRAPKYYVEFQSAGHFAWTNLVSSAHDAILTYSLAFLARYVKGERADGVLNGKRAGVADFRYAAP